jgi:hypothetical protein
MRGNKAQMPIKVGNRVGKISAMPINRSIIRVLGIKGGGLLTRSLLQEGGGASLPLP